MLTEKEIEDIVVAAWHHSKAVHWYRDAAHAIFERMNEGVVWSTVHVNLQKEDGQFWLDLGPLGTLGPVVLPPDMEDADPVALSVRRRPCNEPTNETSGEE